MANEMIVRTQTYLDHKTPKLTKWCKAGVRAEDLCRMALQEIQLNPKLRACTPQSIYIGLLSCAVTGLEPGPLKQEAFLIPFKDEAKFLVGWRGIVKQAIRAGGVQFVRSGIIREGDVFDYDLGTSNQLVHKPRLGSARGDMIGAYAWAQLTNGQRQIEILDMPALEDVRKFAEKRGASPAWTQWPDEMARKTAVRRLGKYLPMDETYFAGARLERAQEADEPDTASEIEILDAMTDGAASEDDRTGGPVSGFTAPTVLDGGKTERAPARSRMRSAAAPIDAKATETPDPPAAAAAPPSSPPSSPPKAPSPTTASTSAPSSAPPASSKSATAADPARDPDGAADDDFEEAFGDPPVAPAAPTAIHGWPATLEGYAAWVNACKTRTEITEHVAPWKVWARDVMKYDPQESPEIKRMGALFKARWTELP